MFVNGVSVGTDANNNQNDWSGGDPAAVGTRGGANTGGIGGGQSGTESFDGEISIFRVYRNQVLTAEEVKKNFNAIAGKVFLDTTGDWGTATNWDTNAEPIATDSAFTGGGLTGSAS